MTYKLFLVTYEVVQRRVVHAYATDRADAISSIKHELLDDEDIKEVRNMSAVEVGRTEAR